MTDQFGGKPTRMDIARYQDSPNWHDGSFSNLEGTVLTPELYKIPGIILKQIKGVRDGEPKKPLPVEEFDREEFLKPSDVPKFIWFGHSVLLMRLNGKTLLIDPMLGPNASPIAPVATRRFSENTLDLIEQLPTIDLLLMTHDHYDHLDMRSIKGLRSKTKQFYVAMGVKRHLVKWGVEGNDVVEFDWWDQHPFDDIDIHFTPTRHFSGRGIKDRAKSLWGGWVFKTRDASIWFSGDGGYGKHFKDIGNRLGPFDIGFMECGQYCDDWPLIHMFPHEAVQAASDAGAEKIVPVHWAGFSLSYQHSWYGPVEGFVEAAQKSPAICLTPALGEQFALTAMESERWWKVHT